MNDAEFFRILALEIGKERDEAHGRQKTPFRPARRRTRFSVGGPPKMPYSSLEFLRGVRYDRHYTKLWMERASKEVP